MNVFVAGIHAVGKSYLCGPYAAQQNWLHRSASQLIKEEMGEANWEANKQVKDAAANQRALVAAVKRINSSGDRILLDGHFVLRGENDRFIYLDKAVFVDLNLNRVILIETEPATIVARLLARDGVHRDEADIAVFLEAERTQAEKVCQELGLPLARLRYPSSQDFASALAV